MRDLAAVWKQSIYHSRRLYSSLSLVTSSSSLWPTFTTTMTKSELSRLQAFHMCNQPRVAKPGAGRGGQCPIPHFEGRAQCKIPPWACKSVSVKVRTKKMFCEYEVGPVITTDPSRSLARPRAQPRSKNWGVPNNFFSSEGGRRAAGGAGPNWHAKHFFSSYPIIFLLS